MIKYQRLSIRTHEAKALLLLPILKRTLSRSCSGNFVTHVRGLVSLFLIASAPLAASGPGYIIPGDPRNGYESTDYQSRSAALNMSQGVPADLFERTLNPPLGLPPLRHPADPARIDLGRRLFFDRRLSPNDTLSCGMCHVPEQAFTQTELSTPVGINGRSTRRNAPALYNVIYRNILFHDARETSLVAQIWAPLLSPDEMGNVSRASVLGRLAQIEEYTEAFRVTFAEGLTENTLGLALAAYQSALLAADSPFDHWYYGGDSAALSHSAKRGFQLFLKHDCSRCHLIARSGALFTDDDVHRTGAGYRRAMGETSTTSLLQVAPGVVLTVEPVSVHRADDYGHEEVTGRPEHRWAYRTPSLRNVAVTAPYMHDGSFATLEAVIEFYNSGGGTDPEKDPLIRPLSMSGVDSSDLLRFLEALTSPDLDRLASDARISPIGERGSPD
ncbi:MAG: cytochrome c peroxidase [Pseudomonadales bacterium]